MRISDNPMRQRLIVAMVCTCLTGPVFAGLLAHYPFESDFDDHSGNGNHLSISGGTPAITSAAGEFVVGAGALDLQSTTSDSVYLSLASNITFAAADAWSISFWGRHRPGTDSRTGMVAGDLTGNNFIWIPSGGAVNGGLRFRNSSGANADYGNLATDSNFHHWVLVADGSGNVTVYRDNVLLGTTAFTTTFEITSVGQAFNGAIQSMNGQIDELRIYDEAIDAAAVGSLFLAGEPEEEPPDEPDAEVSKVQVYLLGGQSNADGRGATSSLPTTPVNLQLPQEDIDFYAPVTGGQVLTLRPGASQFGPEITLGRRLADLIRPDGDTRLAIIKYAVGGTSLQADWKAGGDGTTTGDGPRYVTFQQTVRSGVAALKVLYPSAEVSFEGMLWVQGERDAKGGFEHLYEANLTAFIADVRATYGEDLPFVISRLSDLQTNILEAPRQVVQGAQTAVAGADPRTALVKTDDFGMKSDNLHFDALGLQQIGNAAAEELFAFVPLPAPGLCLLGNGDVEVKLLDALPGYSYTLQSSPSLAENGWTDIETIVATGATVVFTYSLLAQESRRFFRIAMSL